ncbi:MULTISPECIES: aldo/keto reductase [unclassified Polaribacter]|uniref:aldo/keto reductase n=1 Tax=unclassified Polaribacter TaxID=196858 RepID=UPI00052DD873|nr:MULTISPECIES: aldo/keto reductase [unclassified Polaribacter]KGL61288.1 aldo/keto reductase [Polaribacter sp. Hel1_33_49]MBT3741189.1 L-glyceraldehyde 3-phosphate reductase [Polaribacter sp.]MDG1194572.1 aldo/keto reductase [Polaribacter sp.]MDG1402856.1 aldo/keto reductase [Polaribacter sp.]
MSKKSKYIADENRYKKMKYRRTGNSGLLLPELSFGLWHNFGDNDNLNTARNLLKCAFDNGITHFDLANNYGPPPGSAEINFGKILKKDFKNYRDELIISSKAGYGMWPGPYGDFGSKKFLVASLDQSLQRMGLDYVDIFYHHRPDYDTPLEETMGALDLMVRQGKALYVGISNYQPKEAEKAFKILRNLGTPCLIHQPNYNLFNRWIEDGLLDVLESSRVGAICFSPLAQGMLTDKYINGLPKDSRAVKDSPFLNTNQVLEMLPKIKELDEVAKNRNQTLAQMAISWILKDNRITSVLIGASKTEQILDSVKAIETTSFFDDELTKINEILSS